MAKRFGTTHSLKVGMYVYRIHARSNPGKVLNIEETSAKVRFLDNKELQVPIQELADFTFSYQKYLRRFLALDELRKRLDEL